MRRGVVWGWTAASTLAGALIACTSSNNSGGGHIGNDGGGGDGGDRQPIIIGAAVSLTGSLAAIGAAEQNALRVAETQLNARGGILGRPVQFQVRDDGTDDKVATAAVNAFLGTGITGFIGTSGSSQAIAVHQLLTDQKVLSICTSAGTPGLTTAEMTPNRYFFRTTPSHLLQARAMGIVALTGRGIDGAKDGGADASGDAGVSARCHHVAIIHQDDAYGNPIATELTNALGTQANVVVDIKVPATAKASYKAEVGQVAATNADCQAIILFPPAGAQYMIDYKAVTATDTSRDWSRVLSLASNGVYQPTFLTSSRVNPADDTSPTAAEGMVGLQPDSNPPTREFNDFKNLYTAQFPLGNLTDIPTYASNTYDAAVLLALAIQQAESTTDRVKIRDSLFQVASNGTSFGPADVSAAIDALKHGTDIDYKGASGGLDFDANGDVAGDYIIWSVVNGKFVTVGRVAAQELQ